MIQARDPWRSRVEPRLTPAELVECECGHKVYSFSACRHGADEGPEERPWDAMIPWDAQPREPEAVSYVGYTASVVGPNEVGQELGQGEGRLCGCDVARLPSGMSGSSAST